MGVRRYIWPCNQMVWKCRFFLGLTGSVSASANSSTGGAAASGGGVTGFGIGGGPGIGYKW